MSYVGHFNDAHQVNDGGKMPDAHELRMEPRAGLQLCLNLVTALLSVLSHMSEADAAATAPKNGLHKTVRRPASGGVPTVAPGALINLKIDAEEEYDVDEAAKRLAISPQTVRKMINHDKLKAERRGEGRGHWIIQGTELLRFTHQTDDQP